MVVILGYFYFVEDNTFEMKKQLLNATRCYNHLDS